MCTPAIDSANCDIVRLLRAEVAATSAALHKLLEVVNAIKEDIALIREANRSSSNSGTKFVCPLGCGAEFSRVCKCEAIC